MAIGDLQRRLVCGALGIWLTAVAVGSPAWSQAAQIGGVRLSRDSFNPSAGQQVELTYQLESDERVSVHVYDPDNGWVRTLVDSEEREAGLQVESWDGRDIDGEVVPDEAYYFVIETSSGEIYDPTTFSGGEVGDVLKVELDHEGGTINYRLPKGARVLSRLGIHNGPMLKTLVDWKPRVAGTITEYWQGWDEDGVLNFSKHPDFSGIITYVELPATSVIAFGNREATYRAVKLGRARDRPQKLELPHVSAPDSQLRPEGLVPPAWSRAPVVNLTLPDDEGGESEIPEVGDRVRVRVEVDPEDRARLQKDQFEILFFVDNTFFAEVERGYTPLNWVWETHQLPPGEHVLTVNLSSFKGEVGVASRKVRVRQRE